MALKPADYKKLEEAAELMERSLLDCTGHDEFTRKKIVYWTLGTHALEREPSYPILQMWGKFSNGKSTTMQIVSKYCHKPDYIESAKQMTYPVLRDRLFRAVNSTQLIDEGDHILNDADGSKLESLISDRYSKATAKSSHKEKSTDGGWQECNQNIFGATVIHRRHAFKDPALVSRTLVIRFKPNLSREYRQFNPRAGMEPWEKHGQSLVQKLELSLEAFSPIPKMPQRIQDVHFPLLAISKLLGRTTFTEAVIAEMQEKVIKEMREGQQYEPDALILAVIIKKMLGSPEQSSSMDGSPSVRYIRLAEISEAIWQDHQRMVMTSRQISSHAREMGFEVKNSHGDRVIAPTVEALLAACEATEYEDEGVIALKSNQSNMITLTPELRESAKENKKELYPCVGTSPSSTRLPEDGKKLSKIYSKCDA